MTVIRAQFEKPALQLLLQNHSPRLQDSAAAHPPPSSQGVFSAPSEICLCTWDQAWLRKRSPQSLFLPHYPIGGTVTQPGLSQLLRCSPPQPHPFLGVPFSLPHGEQGGGCLPASWPSSLSPPLPLLTVSGAKRGVAFSFTAHHFSLLLPQSCLNILAEELLL